MSDAFDPYYKWLAIPPEEQPPNHYRLLGVNLYEPDPDVISNAADQRMAHVHSFQGGSHAAESQRLLNEISAARVYLLDPKKKAKYDAVLKAQSARAETSEAKIDHRPTVPAQSVRPILHAVPLAQPIPVARAHPEPPAPVTPRPAAVSSAPSADLQPRIRTSYRKQPLPRALPFVAMGAVGILLIGIILTIAMLGGPPPEDQTVRQVGGTQSGQSVPPPASPERSAVPARTLPKPVSSEATGEQPTEEAGGDEGRVAGQPDDAEFAAAEPVPTEMESAAPVDQAPPPPDRRPPPTDASALAAVTERLRATLPNASAREILDTVRAGRHDDVESFALLCLARDAAANAGDPHFAIRSVEELDRQFVIDALEMKVNVLPEVRKHAVGTVALREIAGLAMALTDEAIQLGRLDVAERCAKLALIVARETNDPEMMRVATLCVVKVRKLVAEPATGSRQDASSERPDNPLP